MAKKKDNTPLDDDDDDDDIVESTEGESGESQEDATTEDSTAESGESTNEEDSGQESQEDAGPTAEEIERTKLRERRKREKRMKSEQRRREYFEQQQTILSLQDTVKKLKKETEELKGSVGDTELQRIDGEIRDLSSVYQDAQGAMERAITANDGAAFRKAKEISDRAWQRYNQLELAKTQRKGTAKATPTERASESNSEGAGGDEATTKQPKITLSADAVRYGQAFAKKNANWYKTHPNGQAANLDSMIVQQLDKELYDEGYDPDSKEYWDELETRSMERLPHRAKQQQRTSGTKPKVITGGGGRDGGGSGANVEKNLPGEFVRALKQAGHWDDPKKKKAAIDDYLANRKKG